jgi:ABC-type dipeptide/oligopeptide/nickel transport system ATPase component
MRRPELMQGLRRMKFKDVQARGEASGINHRPITHDMNLTRAVSSRIAVTYQGRIVETGTTASGVHAPAHACMRRLLDAVQDVDD